MHQGLTSEFFPSDAAILVHSIANILAATPSHNQQSYFVLVLPLMQNLHLWFYICGFQGWNNAGRKLMLH